MADAFREQAHIFIQHIGPETDLDKATTHAAGRLGQLMASATTLALAIEIYLKALRILVGMNPSSDHNLWALYKKLPQQLKDLIEASYNKLNSEERTDADGVLLALYGGPMTEEVLQQIKATPAPNGGTDLKSVLLNAGDAFVTWRYLYEKGQPGKIQLFEYGYKRLDFIASALREYTMNGIAQPRPDALKGG